MMEDGLFALGVIGAFLVVMALAALAQERWERRHRDISPTRPLPRSARSVPVVSPAQAARNRQAFLAALAEARHTAKVSATLARLGVESEERANALEGVVAEMPRKSVK